MTTTSKVPARYPWQVHDELLQRGCPVCGAKAREVKIRRTHESWRVHFACRTRLVGFANCIEVEQRCKHALFSPLTEQRLELLIKSMRRRAQA